MNFTDISSELLVASGIGQLTLFNFFRGLVLREVSFNTKFRRMNSC